MMTGTLDRREGDEIWRLWYCSAGVAWMACLEYKSSAQNVIIQLLYSSLRSDWVLCGRGRSRTLMPRDSFDRDSPREWHNVWTSCVGDGVGCCGC